MTVKYIQITISDELHQNLKKKCIDDAVTLNQKFQEMIERELMKEEK